MRLVVAESLTPSRPFVFGPERVTVSNEAVDAVKVVVVTDVIVLLLKRCFNLEVFGETGMCYISLNLSISFCI